MIEPNATRRPVYLPEGDWFDFWTNERHTGKQEVTWKNPDRPDPPQSKIPVFVRSGAIVPLILGEDVQTLCDANYVNNPAIKTWDGGLEIRIYPAGTSRFTVYDGTDVTCQADGGGVKVTINSPKPRPVQLEVLGPRPASGVRRDGTVVNEKADPSDFAKEPSAWRHDPATGFLEIKFAHGGGATTVAF